MQLRPVPSNYNFEGTVHKRRYARRVPSPLIQRGQTLSDDDVDTLRLDCAGVQGYMADAKRDRYFELAEQLFKISGGKAGFVPDTPVMDEQISAICVDLRTKIDSLKRAYREANAQVARSAGAGRVSG